MKTCLTLVSLLVISCNRHQIKDNFVVLLNNDTIYSSTLKNLFAKNSIIYKQYEGFMLLTNDSIFKNPIIITENSISKINSDVVPSAEVEKLLDNNISKIIYSFNIDSLKIPLDSIKEKIIAKYKSYKIDTSNNNLRVFTANGDIICELLYFQSPKNIIIQLYPKYVN